MHITSHNGELFQEFKPLWVIAFIRHRTQRHPITSAGQSHIENDLPPSIPLPHIGDDLPPSAHPPSLGVTFAYFTIARNVM